MAMLSNTLFKKTLKHGTLEVINAEGQSYTFGDGEEPHATIRLHDPKLHWKLYLNPSMKIFEAYMDGTLTIEEGTLYDFCHILFRNRQFWYKHPLQRWVRRYHFMIRRFYQTNVVKRAFRHIKHHYSLSHKFFKLFLDPDLQYSCAFFLTPDMSLATAQQTKKARIAKKLRLESGMRILDIGCGWGGMALYLGRVLEDIEIVGITLSEEQLKVAQNRALSAGLSDRIRFSLCDYRDVQGTYDRVVSVGMFEHVGKDHFEQFFHSVKQYLNPNGLALLHTIGRCGTPAPTAPWFRKYIFPGGYIPSLSEVLPAIEKSSLWVTDIEVLHLHYAETLRHWRTNFTKNRAHIRQLYDEKFCRMWECYLISSELSFRYGVYAVYQIQFSNNLEATPMVRDYMTPTHTTPVSS